MTDPRTPIARSLSRLSEAVASVGYLRRCRFDSQGADLLLEFAGVQLVEPDRPLDDGAAPALEIELHHGGAELGLCDASDPAFAAGWAQALLEGELAAPLFLTPTHFGFDDRPLVESLRRLMIGEASMVGSPPESWRHTVSFIAGSVIVIAGADVLSFRLAHRELPLAALLAAHQAWRAFHRDYWLRKGTPVEAPLDYVCETSGRPPND
ncbi:MAG: hypothetical protein KC609_19550 [Myxococcales bacterium]|nr:hypothetical protein [Myxococcales bacterium]